MAWSQITSTEIAEYKPVTSRLMTKYKDNLEACRIGTIPMPTTINDTTNSSTFTTIATMPLFVPDCFIGANGIKFTFYFSLSGTDTPRSRVTIGAVSGATLVGDTNTEASITRTGISEGVYDVIFEARTQNGGAEETSLAVLYGRMELLP